MLLQKIRDSISHHSHQPLDSVLQDVPPDVLLSLITYSYMTQGKCHKLGVSQKLCYFDLDLDESKPITVVSSTSEEPPNSLYCPYVTIYLGLPLLGARALQDSLANRKIENRKLTNEKLESAKIQAP
jgi:hypothetical protein